MIRLNVSYIQNRRESQEGEQTIVLSWSNCRIVVEVQNPIEWYILILSELSALSRQVFWILDEKDRLKLRAWL